MFLFRLALALGRSVGELEEELSYPEFLEWMAFARMEPFGDERNELHAAGIMATIANMAGKTLPRGKKVSVMDMLLFRRGPKLSGDAAALAAVPGVRVLRAGAKETPDGDG